MFYTKSSTWKAQEKEFQITGEKRNLSSLLSTLQIFHDQNFDYLRNLNNRNNCVGIFLEHSTLTKKKKVKPIVVKITVNSQ